MLVSFGYPGEGGRKDQVHTTSWNYGHKMSTDKHYNKGMAFVKGVIVGVIKDIDP